MIIKVYASGNVTCIHHGPADDVLLAGIGKPAISFRASRVEPISVLLRFVFHIIRARVGDGSRLAGWTRTWKCVWRTRVFNGPTLEPFDDRRAAIDAEVEWLMENRI